MPSKKSKSSSPIESPSQENISKELDKFLPIANVSRIMKKSLPPNAKISKEAKETVQECVSEFISFVTGEASDRCQREKRKTINGDDLLWAMTTLGFDNYVGPLKLYLNKYREIEGEKSNNVGSPANNNPTNPNSGESLSVNHNGINNDMDKGSSASHSHVTNNLDFENFSGSMASSFYSLSAQKSYVNIGGSSYGVNNFNTVVNQDIHGGGGDDQSVNVGPHLQYGIGW